MRLVISPRRAHRGIGRNSFATRPHFDLIVTQHLRSMPTNTDLVSVVLDDKTLVVVGEDGTMLGNVDAGIIVEARPGTAA